MMEFRRGDIYSVDMPQNDLVPTQTRGRHYYVIVSNTTFNRHSEFIQAVPLTSNVHRFYSGQKEIQLKGHVKPSKIMGDQLSLFPKKFFFNGKLIGTLSPENMEIVDECIAEHLS